MSDGWLVTGSRDTIGDSTITQPRRSRNAGPPVVQADLGPGLTTSVHRLLGQVRCALSQVNSQ